MKHYSITLITFLLLFSHTIFSQRGKDGAYTVTSGNTVLNTYTYLTANATAGATTLSVNSNSMTGGIFSGSLAAGDLLLIVQMQGAEMDIQTYTVTLWGANYTIPSSYNTTWGSQRWTWGQVTNYNQAGVYEQVEVRSVNGTGTISLNCGLQNNYTASGHVQVIRVARLTTLTLNASSSITAPAWDGNSGGIVALEVNGNVVFNSGSKITVSGKGFRGAVADNTGSTGSSSTYTANGGYGSDQLGSTLATEGGRKGEGIGGYVTEYAALYSNYGMGAPANGGGGGGFQNSGGGGGSNIGSGTYTGKGIPSTSYASSVWNLETTSLGGSSSPGGGRGGYSLLNSDQNELTLGPNQSAWSGDARKENGGLGGHALTYSAARLFFGGGGGAGDQDSGQGGGGGNGGGLVFMTVYGAVSGTGSIEADGAVGLNSNPNSQTAGVGQKKGNDGAGGGGGGGAIYIKNSTALPATLSLYARGGAGGNQVLTAGSFASINEAGGPGAGGAGGSVAFTSGTPVQLVTGGAAGTTNSGYVSNFAVNGATGGGTGISGISTTIYTISALNDTVCSGASATLTATVSGTFTGTLYWYTQQFGGTSVGSGTTYTTPVLTSTTTYYVGTCPGTYRVPVVVTVNPNPTIAGTAVLTNPSCLNAGSISGLSVSGGTPAYTYLWNGSVNATLNLSNATAGTYNLVVSDQKGCKDSIGPFTLSGTSGPVLNENNVTVQDVSCMGVAGSVTGITATGSSLTYQWSNGGGTSLNATGLAAGTYTLTVTDGNGCTSTSADYTVGTSTGPAIDASNVVISPEHCASADGSITGIVTSGSGLTFYWNGTTATADSIFGQIAGNYTLVVTDAYGCSDSTGPFTIGSVAAPVIDTSNMLITTAACGSANGSISGITVSGGSPAYSYVWSNTSQTSLDISSLAAGTYSLTVTDLYGCTVNSGSIVVASANGPVLDESSIVVNNIDCNGNAGSVSGILASGTSLSYLWSNGGGTSLDATGLLPGTYQLTVTDGNGCTATSSSYTISAVIPMVLDSSNLVVQNATCNAANGSISGLIVYGGVNPAFSWSNNDTVLTINGLSAGNYQLLISDDQGCSINASFVVGSVNSLVLSTTNQVITASHCTQADGSVAGITVVGGTPAYSFTWDGMAISSQDVNGLLAGTYLLEVSDANGCQDQVAVVIPSESGPVISDASLQVVQPLCNQTGSIIGLTASGNGTLTYSWTGSSATTPDISGLQAGAYTLSVVDSFGCTTNYGPVTLTQTAGPDAVFSFTPSQPLISQTVSFTDASTGSIVLYSWIVNSDTLYTEDITYVFDQLGSYPVTLTVVDQNGCTDSETQLVNVTGSTLTVPNVITANNDGLNDLFVIEGLKENTSLTIINRWGEVVFNSGNYQNNWNGHDNAGNELADGVYNYIIQPQNDQKIYGFIHLMH